MIPYHLVGIGWILIAVICALDSDHILAALSLYTAYSHAKEGIQP